MTGVKSKKDRPAKNPKENLSKHRQSHLRCFFFLFICFEMYMSASRKQDFHCVSYILFPVNLINVNRVVYPFWINEWDFTKLLPPAVKLLQSV